MPFGEKMDVDGKLVDFDKIYNFIIKQAVESINIRCIRCDEIEESGWIHGDMFNQILEADVSIVDITSLNANVFYELGIRHSLAGSVTVLIRKKGTYAPFNIQGLRIIEYDPLDLASVDKAKHQIVRFIQNGLRYKSVDSPVHQALENRISIEKHSETILETEYLRYQMIENSKYIGLVTGDIRDVRQVDVWVNSENSNMQMDRYYDRSISSIIRYLGASKDDAGHVTKDTIAEELTKKMDGAEFVPQGHVIETSSGELLQTHNVKLILHVASVVGEIGQGYRIVNNYNLSRCIANVLQCMEEISDPEVNSIIFPLIGVGKGQGNLQKNSALLIKAAISYFETRPNSSIGNVYFLVHTYEELDVCKNLLDQNPKLKQDTVGSSADILTRIQQTIT